VDCHAWFEIERNFSGSGLDPNRNGPSPEFQCPFCEQTSLRPQGLAAQTTVPFRRRELLIKQRNGQIGGVSALPRQIQSTNVAYLKAMPLVSNHRHDVARWVNRALAHGAPSASCTISVAFDPRAGGTERKLEIE
jgi:hypothetical protein